MRTREEEGERRRGAIELFRERLPGIGRVPRDRPAWLLWLVLFMCILFPILVVFAD